jgi:LPXTG-motif cell wall-anchored protein
VRKLALLAAGALVAACCASTAGAVTVKLESGPVTTSIGRHFTFRTAVVNPSAAPATDLVAHLNVLSDDPGTYVDPEDWSSHRTQYLPQIPPHGTLPLTWTVQAVNSGHLTVFVSVLPRHGPGAVATSAPLRFTVAQRRTLDSSGVLPVVLGIPAAIGLAGLGTRRRRRS